MKNNWKDLIIKSLNKSGKKDQIISSIIYNSIISDYKSLKNIDIQKYIISVKISKNIAIVKTNKPIINSELYSVKDILLKNITSKLNDLNLAIVNLDIIFK